MSSAALPLQSPRRFFPLHLKLMLSYLVLATAILTVSSALAWRESSAASQRVDADRNSALQSRVMEEFGRRQERALAAVNLAAVSGEFLARLAAGGAIPLGTSGAAQDTRAVARFLPGSDKALTARGITPRMPATVSGAMILDGKPQVVAAAPVDGGQAGAGILLISVDLSPVLQSVASGGHAFWARPNAAGAVAIGQAGTQDSSPQINLSAIDRTHMAAGQAVSSTAAGGETLLLPLPGTDRSPELALAISAPAQNGFATANPYLALAVLTVSLGLFIAHFLARSLSRPVERITAATERVAAGDFVFRLPVPKSHDELAVLHDSFNRMTDRYRRSQAEVGDAALRLEQTVLAQEVEIETLFGISQAITSTLEIPQLMTQALALSLPLAGGDQGAAWLAGGERLETGTVEAAPLRLAAVVGDGAAATINAGHPLVVDQTGRGWRLCTIFSEDESRELFYAAESETAPYRRIVERQAGEALPDGVGGARTQVVLPLPGQQGRPGGMLALSVEGRRFLSDHEALLLVNIANLTAVAIENASLYDLAQQRGEQIATLLKESHHRITNNLAAIAGVLSIQSARTGQPELAAMIDDNISRIGSIAQVHRLLSGDLKDEVELSGMIHSIAGRTIEATGEGVSLSVAGARLLLPAKQATAVALVMNELIINSLKHGFAGRGGAITIAYRRTGGTVLLDYSDDGCGRSGAPAKSGAGLGMQIIDSLVRFDLEGEWWEESGPGFHIRLRFPLPRKDIRHAAEIPLSAADGDDQHDRRAASGSGG
jgi:two-component sensor histidine kinase/HAMP domain-containing protein